MKDIVLDDDDDETDELEVETLTDSPKQSQAIQQLAQRQITLLEKMSTLDALVRYQAQQLNRPVHHYSFPFHVKQYVIMYRVIKGLITLSMAALLLGNGLTAYYVRAANSIAVAISI